MLSLHSNSRDVPERYSSVLCVRKKQAFFTFTSQKVRILLWREESCLVGKRRHETVRFPISPQLQFTSPWAMNKKKLERESPHDAVRRSGVGQNP